MIWWQVFGWLLLLCLVVGIIKKILELWLLHKQQKGGDHGKK